MYFYLSLGENSQNINEQSDDIVFLEIGRKFSGAVDLSGLTRPVILVATGGNVSIKDHAMLQGIVIENGLIAMDGAFDSLNLIHIKQAKEESAFNITSAPMLELVGIGQQYQSPKNCPRLKSFNLEGDLSRLINLELYGSIDSGTLDLRQAPWLAKADEKGNVPEGYGEPSFPFITPGFSISPSCNFTTIIPPVGNDKVQQGIAQWEDWKKEQEEREKEPIEVYSQKDFDSLRTSQKANTEKLTIRKDFAGNVNLSEFQHIKQLCMDGGAVNINGSSTLESVEFRGGQVTMTGAFPSLEDLIIDPEARIDNINITSAPKLKEFAVMIDSPESLATIKNKDLVTNLSFDPEFSGEVDLSPFKNLKGFFMRSGTVTVNDSQSLEKINASGGVINMAGSFPALKSLDLSWVQGCTIDINSAQNLEKVEMFNGKLDAFSMKGNLGKLTQLSLAGEINGGTLDLSKASSLPNTYVDDEKIGRHIPDFYITLTCKFNNIIAPNGNDAIKEEIEQWKKFQTKEPDFKTHPDEPMFPLQGETVYSQDELDGLDHNTVENLAVNNNGSEAITVQNFPNLTRLTVNNAFQYTGSVLLDALSTQKLKEIQVDDGSIAIIRKEGDNLYLSSCENLEKLDFSGGYIKMNGTFPQLNTLNVNKNEGDTDIKIWAAPKLKTIDMKGISYPASLLLFGDLGALQTISLENQINGTLDLTQATNLKSIDIGERCNITAINLPKALKDTLDISNIQGDSAKNITWE